MYHYTNWILNHRTKYCSSLVRFLCNSNNKRADSVTAWGSASKTIVNTSNSEQTKGSEKDINTVSIQRIITQDDLEKFAHLTGDHNPIHFTSQGRSIVHGALLNGLVSGVIGTKLPGPGTLVVSQTLRFPAPCFVGDKITITVKVTSSRKIITCKYECGVEGEKIVMDGEAKLVHSKHSI